MSAVTTKLDAALDLLSLGVPVVAEHTPDPSKPGKCSCGRRDCSKPGKHPRTSNGSHDATKDEAQVGKWWDLWPEANPGTDAELAGLVIIAPDSPEWDAEFQRRGVETSAIVQSGGGEGHKQYWFKRSPSCPAVNINKPDEYDFLAAGNVVMPGAEHASGNRYTWIRRPESIAELPEEPAWVREEFLQVAAKRSSYTPPASDEAEPIVRLRPRGMQRWLGELVERKRDGTVDHSDSLFFLGLELAEAGASRRGIVEELARRDVALGWNKYTDRSDAAKRYGEIADKAVKRALEQEQASESTVITQRYVTPNALGNAPHTWPKQESVSQEPGPLNDQCSPHCDRHLAQIQNLETKLAAKEELLTSFRAIMANPNESLPTKAVALAAEWVLESKASRGLPSKIYAADVAEALGISDDTANRHLARAYDRPDSAYVRMPTRERVAEIIDPSTGECRKVKAADVPPGAKIIKAYPQKTFEYRPRQETRPERLRTLATLTRETPRHGGKRVPRCLAHPNAGTYQQTRCQACHRVVLGPDWQEPQDAEVAARPPSHPTVSRSFHQQDAVLDVGFDRAPDGQPPPLFQDVMVLGGQHGFPPIVVNGRMFRGQKAWDTLKDTPSLLPRAYELAEQYARSREARLL